MRRSTFLLGVLLLLSSAEAAPQFAVEVTASRLNVRNRVMGSILGQVDQGDRLVVTAQSGSWLQIDWGGRSAWISSSYARRTAATIDVVTASYLNVRSGPSTGYSVMGSARGGQGLVVLQRRSGWNLVQFDSRAGWVSSSYTRPFTNGGSSTAPAPPPASSGGRSPAMQATAAEVEILARICKGEAGIASYENKVAVAAVVLNRVRSRRHPNSIRSVAHQPYQFSCYNPNMRNRLYYGPIPQDCWRAAREALAGRDPSLGATFYFNPYLVLPSWARGMTRTVRIGTRRSDTHDFYRP
ncbi:MAG: cell wall hydrolase [Planctomycetes bacterium]|nr:cell wall hydrolase [Planctomycetota bacterium]